VTKGQTFWLTATPVVLGSLLRIPYGIVVSKYGSRRSYAVVTLLLVVPCAGAGLALRDASTSFETLLFWSAVTGIAGANFSTSMAVVTLWFPKAKQGLALGINGLGNLGVTVAQLLVPVVIGASVLGAIGGPSQTLSAKGATELVWLQNAALVWIPMVLLATAAIWFGTKDAAIAPKSLASQLAVARDVHTWTISCLYFLTFGCFVAMGASLPLIIQSVFAKAPGGAPNPLVYAPMAPLVATLMRPIGGWAADRFGAGRVTAIAIAVMGVGGLSLGRFLAPHAFQGFFTTILIICAASGLGNGSVFKIIPTVSPKQAGAVIGFVACIGALGGFFPPLLLGWCIDRFGSPAWAYVAMALFAVACFALNGWLYWRRASKTHC
jgi:NNP family nitrate/nitrite transporter-like MFS transporter